MGGESGLNRRVPELAEVEFYRRRWWEAAAGRAVRAAHVWPGSRVFRRLAAEFRGGAPALGRALAGARLVESAAHGKQMWFVFAPRPKRAAGTRHSRPPPRLWVGVHLGMSGELRVEPRAYRAAKHDALVLEFPQLKLVFNDPRQFGRVCAWLGPPGEPAPWLRKLPAEVTAPEFTVERLRALLARHGRAPLKAVLLRQDYFPGIGNWMADEILWRAALHPALPARRAAPPRVAARLHEKIREVARDARRVIAGVGGPLPADLNVDIPPTWLFLHRWADGGRCPLTKRLLRRAEIGGRTSCWSPARQRLRR